MRHYFTKKIWTILILSSLFLIFESFVAIVETDFTRALMYQAVYKGDLVIEVVPVKMLIGDNNIYALYKLGTLNLSLILFAVLIGGVIFGALGTWLSSKSVSLLTSRMRYLAYKKIQNFSYEDVDKFSTPSLITRLTTDVELANMSFSFSSKFTINGIFTIIFGIVKSGINYSQWVVTYAYIIPIIFVFMTCAIGYAVPKMKTGQKAIDGVNKQIRESILGIRVIKAYNLETSQKEKFTKPNTRLADCWYKAFAAIGLLMPIIQCLVTGLIVVIYYMSYANYDNIQKASELIGFIGILMQVLFGFIITMVTLTQVSRAIPSIKRINEVTKYEPTLKFDNDSKLQISQGSIEFKNVYHSFVKDNKDEHNILKNINFKINPKERIGIIGATGSGKSTIVNLIGRLFDSTRGQILIDGQDIKKYSFNEINSNIAIAMQNATLFSGTIKSNIAFGLPENISDEELEKQAIEAAKAAEAWEFISKKEDKLESKVEQRGKNFSGGQKQRISIARTIAKKSKIVIFDDSTSALDTITERKVQSNLRTYNDATTIIVAQRISSVEELDKVIVLNDGEIVGFDSHWNLLKDNDIYRSIAASQLGTEELNEMLKERGLKQIEKTSINK